MIIGIRIDSMNPRTSISKHTNSCFFTMVAKDEDGSPKKVPELKLENHEELKRFVEGKILKKLSKEKRQLLDKEVENYSESNLLTNCKNERCDVSNLK